MYKAPESFFKPDALYREQNYWLRFIPFVLRPDFMRSLLETLKNGKMEMDVKCWSSTPPLCVNPYFDRELHTNPRTGVRSSLFPIINREHVLAHHQNKKSIEYGYLYDYGVPQKAEKGSTPYVYMEKYHKDLCDWHKRVRETRVKLHINDVLALMYHVYIKYMQTEQVRVPVRVRDSGDYYDYTYAARNNRVRFVLKRAFPKKQHPALSQIFSQDDLKIFISSCFKRKYKMDLALHLERLGFWFQVIGVTGTLNSLCVDKKFLAYMGLTSRFVPESIVDTGDGTRYFYRCTCCDKIHGGSRVIYPIKNEGTFQFYTKRLYEERCKQRQANPAKYSSNPKYREPPSNSQLEKKKDLSPFKPHVDKFGAVNSYVRDVATALNDHFIKLDTASQSGGNQKTAHGGYQQSTHVDEFEINHFEWERKEYPVRYNEVIHLNTIDNGKLVFFVCKACDDWVTLWIHQFNNQRADETRVTLPPPPETWGAWQPTGTMIPDGVGTRGLVQAGYTISGDTAKGKRVLPRASRQIYVIQEHRANPLDHCEQSFLLAPGENKKIQKVPIYNTRGTLVGLRNLDRTLYMGIELEVTPSHEATKFIEGAIEIPLKNEHQSGFYYQETKYVASMVACRFFAHNNIAIVKHDGSTANGFEIVSVPGTHKWHIEHGWNGFFKEDYDDTLLKELAPSTWLCGWVNNGGRSANPIYAYQTPEGRRPVCGIHIHVSRDAISPLTLGKLLHFTTNPQSLKFIEEIAGRNEKKYAKIIPQKVKDGKILHTITSGSGRSNDYLQPERKYEALNIHTGKPTIEFRIFRSNVSKAGFMKNIDFVHALVTWCQQEASLDFNKLNVDNFVAWCNTQRGVYKYLTQWLVQKKYLSTIHQFNPKYHNPIVFEDDIANEEKVA